MPPDHLIRAEIDVDQRFIGEDYAVPSAESIAAIRELAQAEGVFVGPVYTGKGFAGMLDQVRSGRIAPGSNVAFLHTATPATYSKSPKSSATSQDSPDNATGLRIDQTQYRPQGSTAVHACSAADGLIWLDAALPDRLMRFRRPPRSRGSMTLGWAPWVARSRVSLRLRTVRWRR